MITEIADYFESLAKKHPELLHSQDSKRFLFASPEQLANLKNVLDLQKMCVVMVWVQTEFEFKQTQGFEHFEFACKIIQVCEAGNYAKQLDAQNQSYRIAQDFIAKIMADIENKCQTNSPFDYNEISDMSVIPNIEEESTESYGVILTFKIKTFLRNREIKWQI